MTGEYSVIRVDGIRPDECQWISTPGILVKDTAVEEAIQKNKRRTQDTNDYFVVFHKGKPCWAPSEEEKKDWLREHEALVPLS